MSTLNPTIRQSIFDHLTQCQTLADSLDAALVEVSKRSLASAADSAIQDAMVHLARAVDEISAAFRAERGAA